MLPERQTLSHEGGEVKLREGWFLPIRDAELVSYPIWRRKNKEQPTVVLLLRIPECFRLNADSAMESESGPLAMDAVSPPYIRRGTHRTRSYTRLD